MTDIRPPQPLPEAFLAWRRLRLGRTLGTELVAPPPSDLPPESRRHLLQQARELYWEELSWEHLTGEEGVGARGLVELAFPGFLTFVDGLLLREASAHSPAPARPRPEVVEDVLRFLAGRCIELQTDEQPVHGFEREMTMRLIDLVLYRLHGLRVEEADRLELVWADDD